MNKMIEVKLLGVCEDCRCADLEAHRFRKGTGYTWIVTCKHNDACERIMAKLEVEE